MTVEQFKKATELCKKITQRQEELLGLDSVLKSPSPYVATGKGQVFDIPPEIRKEVVGLLKTEYGKQLEDLKKEFEEL